MNLLSVTEWASLRGCSRRVAYKWVRENRIPSIQQDDQLWVSSDTPMPETKQGRPSKDASTKDQREKAAQRAYREKQKEITIHRPENPVKAETAPSRPDTVLQWFLNPNE